MTDLVLEPVLVTAPTATPVSLEEAKAQCRVDHDDEDLLLTYMIEAATAHVERTSGRVLVTQTWRAFYSGFEPDVLWLPRRPVQSIEAIDYFDENDDPQTADDALYALYAADTGPHVRLTTGSTWPSAYERDDAVAVEFVAGYGSADSVPAPMRHAILMMVSGLYDNRGHISVDQSIQIVPGAFDALMSTYWVPRV